MGISKLKSQREQHMEKLKAGGRMAFEERKLEHGVGGRWHEVGLQTAKGKGTQVRQERAFNKGKIQ